MPRDKQRRVRTEWRGAVVLDALATSEREELQAPLTIGLAYTIAKPVKLNALPKERPCPRSRRESSNGCRCACTGSSRASRCTTCGRSTWQARAPGSRSTSFYAPRTSDSTRSRRSCEVFWTYVFLSDASSDGTAHDR